MTSKARVAAEVRNRLLVEETKKEIMFKLLLEKKLI